MGPAELLPLLICPSWRDSCLGSAAPLSPGSPRLPSVVWSVCVGSGFTVCVLQ